MPSKPRTARTAAVKAVPVITDATVQDWDAYVEEATPQVTPFRKRLPGGRILEVGCPLADQIDALGEAQMRGDVQAMFDAVFGDDAAELLELTAKQPFTLRVRLINDVMLHYGMDMNALPNSPASST